MQGFIGFACKKDFQLSQEVDSAEWVPALEVSKTLFPNAPENVAYAIYKIFFKKEFYQSKKILM